MGGVAGACGLSMIFTEFYSHTCFDIWEFAEGDFFKTETDGDDRQDDP